MSRLWLGLACFSLTCARPGPLPRAHAEASAAPAARPLGKVSHPPRGPAPGALPARVGPLVNFFDALNELQERKRREHVRVLWLGDSHTNADFLSGAVRNALAARFGDGGPGFVRVGAKPYRHDGVKLARDGAWNIDPDPPARRAPQDDGIFGLGGTRAEPKSGASFGLQVVARAPEAAELARFEIAYTLPDNASFSVKLGSHERRVDAKTPAEEAASGVRHLSLAAPLGSQLSLAAERGRPRFFGVIVERSGAPGVVIDTLGIDGARLQTPLAWNEPAFVEEVARRSPQLIVIAYGTNEAFDSLKVEKYGPQLAQLVARARRGQPSASCLVLGPTDAPLAEGSVPRVGEVTEVLRRAATEVGCSFVGLQSLMGGEGSFARGMRAKERLAQPDRLHLTPKGYQELGAALGALLLGAHSAGRVDL